jgi:hypothetical protein
MLILGLVAPPTLTALERALRTAWSLWTADPADHHDRSGVDPASGQCASTALIVHDTFGGTLLMAHLRRADGSPAGFHYFNRLPDGTEIDLTREQFHDGERLVDVAEVEIPPTAPSAGSRAHITCWPRAWRGSWRHRAQRPASGR